MYIETVYNLDGIYIDMIHSLNTLRWCLILFTATAIISTWLIQTLVNKFPPNVVVPEKKKREQNVTSLLKPGQSSMSGASYGLSLELNIEPDDYLKGGQVRES